MTDEPTDPADEPSYQQLGDRGNPFTSGETEEASYTTEPSEAAESAGDSTRAAADAGADADADADSDAPGFEGEAPNLPLASQGSRDGSDTNDAEQGNA